MKLHDVLRVFFIFGIGTLVKISLSAERYSKERLYKQGDIILGGLFPFHLDTEDEKCSDLRSTVLMYSEAMIHAVEEINRNATVLQNVTLGYDIHDTCGSDQQGVNVASDFVFKNTLKFDSRFLVTNTCIAQVTLPKQPPILAVIGGLDSRVSVNVANVLQVLDIPQISYGASSAELATSDFTSFFRTVPVDDYQSRAMAELVHHYGWTCVAVIGVDDWYGRSGVDAFVKAANETGICIVMRQLFPVVDSEAIIEQMVTQLKNMIQVQIIILYSLVPQAKKVFEEALRQGLTGRTWIASDGWAESLLIQESRFKPIVQGAIGFGFHAFAFDSFKKHVLRVTPLMQKGPWWNEFWRNQFNCSAANFSSPMYDPCSGQERISLEKYERDFSQGLSPYVRDAVYSVAYALEDLLKCSAQGQSCSERISALRPEDVLTKLKSLSFKGLTGQINFQKNEVEAAYDIYNLQTIPQAGYNLTKIGSWNAGKLIVEDGLVQWHNNVKPRSTCAEICKPGTYRSTSNRCSWECIPCDLDTVTDESGSTECTRCAEGFISNHNNSRCEEVAITFVDWGDTWGVVLSVLTGFCVLLTIVVSGIVIKYYQTPIIQETSGILNLIMLIFVLLSFLFNAIHLSKLTDSSCRALPPVFYFIYTGGAVVQFLKIYRIRVLVKAKDLQASHEREKVVFSITVALWLAPFFVSLLWVVVDPPEFQKHILSRLEVQAMCSWYKTNLGPVLRYFCAVYLGLILAACVIAAYGTKNLPHGHRFDEAKHLAFSLTVFAITLATFYPGWAFLIGPSLTIFTCLTNLVAATGTLFCNFAPKLWLLFIFPRHNTKAYIRPAPAEVRSVRSSTLISIGNVAIAIQSGERQCTPVSSLSRGSPRSSPKRGSPRDSPKRGSPQALSKRGSPGVSLSTFPRDSPDAFPVGAPGRSRTRFSSEVKTYV